MLRRPFSTSACLYRIPLNVKSRLELVLNNLDEYKKFAEVEAESYKSRSRLTRDEQLLQMHLKRRIDEFLRARPKFVPQRKPLFIFNHPMMYKRLGVTKEDLQSKYKTGMLVEKELEKDNIARAAALVKLAGGDKGTIGMNKLLRWLTVTKRRAIAIRMRSMFKKRRIVADEYTFAAMLPDKSNKSPRINKGMAKILMNEFGEAMNTANPDNVGMKLVLVNSTLKTLCGIAKHVQLEYFYNNLAIKDVITYTSLLNSLGRRSTADDPEAHVPRDFLEKVWNDAISDKNIKIDARLVRARIYALLNTDRKFIGDEAAGERALSAFRQYFDVDFMMGKPANKALFPMDGSSFDLFLQACKSAKRDKEFSDYFKYAMRHRSNILELHHYYTYFEILSRNGWVEDLRPVYEKIYKKNSVIGLPSAEMTGMALATYSGIPVKLLSIRELTSIVLAHRKLWKSTVIFSDIGQPFLKQFLRKIEEGRMKETCANWREELYLDVTYKLILKSVRCAMTNLIENHNAKACISVFDDFISIAQHLSEDCKPRRAASKIDEFAKVIIHLHKALEGSKLIEARVVMKYEDQFLTLLESIGIYEKNDLREALKSEKAGEKRHALNKRARLERIAIHLDSPVVPLRKRDKIEDEEDEMLMKLYEKNCK